MPEAPQPANLPLCAGRHRLAFGSDLLYERRHLPALVRCIGALAAPGASLLVADPGRDGLGLFTDALARAGWRCELEPRGEIYVIAARRG